MVSWQQYHGNNANAGSIAVNTAAALAPLWSMLIGKTGFASPVIDAEGIIYIGTLEGELVAVNVNGSIKWRRKITSEGNPDHPGAVTASPTIGSDGNIYVITTVNSEVQNRRNFESHVIQIRRSSLHSFTPQGNRRWSFRFPGQSHESGWGAYTNSSPKIPYHSQLFIFMPAIYIGIERRTEILVVNQLGNLINKIEVANDIPSSMTRETAHVVDENACVWDFMNFKGDSNDEQLSLGWPEPTLALLNTESDEGIMVVVEDNYKTLAAYRWNFPVLIPRWSKQSSKIRLSSSPSINSKYVAEGRKEGEIAIYDLYTGNEISKPWFKTDEPIRSIPIFKDNHFYVVSGTEFLKIDMSGKVIQQYTLSGKCLGSIALSANYAYVSTTAGFYSITLDFEKVVKNPDVIGISTPSIAPDGSVYVMDQKGYLWAFS